MPICIITLVDNNRQWFKSCYGLSVSQTGRDEAFCAHDAAINGASMCRYPFFRSYCKVACASQQATLDAMPPAPLPYAEHAELLRQTNAPVTVMCRNVYFNQHCPVACLGIEAVFTDKEEDARGARKSAVRAATLQAM